MRRDDTMKDPFYAQIMFEVESQIFEADRRATQKGFTLSDSNVRSVLVKAINLAGGKQPKQGAPSAPESKDQLLGELLQALVAAKDTLLEADERPDGTEIEIPLGTADWIKALKAVKDSCALRMNGTPGSRYYLDYLIDFIPQAGRAF